MTRLRVVVVSTFFPNVSAPYRTLFVRHLVTALAGHVDVNVIAPVPYAPRWPPRKRWSALRRIPYTDRSGAIPVDHPRYVVIPKIDAFSGLTYASAVAPTLRRLARSPGIDVIHAHCAYPDAVGVARVARRLGVPFVVTAHGSDINIYAGRKTLRPQILQALRQASAIIAVSEDLRGKICALDPGLSPRVHCIPCSGVNPEVFHLAQEETARSELDSDGRTVLFVGNLVPIKGLDTLVEAWRLLLRNGGLRPEDRLVLIGDGPLRGHLQEVASEPDLAGTLHVLGPLAQKEIAGRMRTATLLCLASLNEGMPNVVVEALASGLPVVASAVGGIPDLVRPGVNGDLVASGDAPALAEALGGALKRKWDARQIAVTVGGYNWETLAARNLEVLARAVPVR